jgi:hypothetical protein
MVTQGIECLRRVQMPLADAIVEAEAAGEAEEKATVEAAAAEDAAAESRMDAQLAEATAGLAKTEADAEHLPPAEAAALRKEAAATAALCANAVALRAERAVLKAADDKALMQWAQSAIEADVARCRVLVSKPPKDDAFHLYAVECLEANERTDAIYEVRQQCRLSGAEPPPLPPLTLSATQLW